MSARIAGDIRYENVTFAYAEGLPALKNVSFHAPTGRNGCPGGRNGGRQIDIGEFA